MKMLDPVGTREINQRTGEVLSPVRAQRAVLPLVYGRSHEPYAYIVPADAFGSEARLAELAALLRVHAHGGRSARESLRPLALAHRLDAALEEIRDDSIR